MKRTGVEDRKLDMHITFCAQTHQAALKHVEQVPRPALTLTCPTHEPGFCAARLRRCRGAGASHQSAWRPRALRGCVSARQSSTHSQMSGAGLRSAARLQAPKDSV